MLKDYRDFLATIGGKSFDIPVEIFKLQRTSILSFFCPFVGNAIKDIWLIKRKFLIILYRSNQKLFYYFIKKLYKYWIIETMFVPFRNFSKAVFNFGTISTWSNILVYIYTQYLLPNKIQIDFRGGGGDDNIHKSEAQVITWSVEYCLI